MSLAMIAFWTWSRFSASSQTTEWGPSMTDVADLLAAVGREAVQDDAVGFGEGHQGVVEAVTGKGLEPLLLLRLLPHARPDVGIEDIGVLDRLLRVVGQGDAGCRRVTWPIPAPWRSAGNPAGRRG